MSVSATQAPRPPRRDIGVEIFHAFIFANWEKEKREKQKEVDPIYNGRKGRRRGGPLPSRWAWAGTCAALASRGRRRRIERARPFRGARPLRDARPRTHGTGPCPPPMEPSPTPPPTPTNSGPGGDPSSRIPDPSDQPVMRTRTAPAPFCHRARGSPPAVCARFVLPAPRAPGPPSPVPRRCPTAVVTSPAAMPPSYVHLRERTYMHVRARAFSLVASASALLTDPRSPSLTHTVDLRLLSALSRPDLALSRPCSRTLR